MTMNETITLVTGGNRGMGYEIIKELSQKGQHVIMGSRSLEKGQQAAVELGKLGLNVEVIALDVTNHESVVAAVTEIEKKFDHLDVLINNAGASFDHFQAPSKIPLETVRKDFEINYFGLIDVTQQFLPLLKNANTAKILNMSSMMGSKTEALNPESSVYRASAVGYQSAKAAANMFTVQLAKEFVNNDVPITVNAIDPGMVATAFGSGDSKLAESMGAMPVDEGVARIVELALDQTNQDTATFTNTHGTVGW